MVTSQESDVQVSHLSQDWETAKTCFEGALQHRKDKVVFSICKICKCDTFLSIPGEFEKPLDDTAPGGSCKPGGADR